MNSEKLHVRIQHLEQKIMHLLKQCEEQKKKIQQLQKEKLMSQGTNRSEAVNYASNRLELSASTKDERITRDWEARIDSYISDLDKSIAYLEQL